MNESIEIATMLLRRDDVEGLRLAPYRCPAGYWTIGIGNRFLADGSPVTASTPPLTEGEALNLLRHTLDNLRAKLDDAISVPLTPCQAGALLSWQFNIGSTAMYRSTLRTLLNQGQYCAAGEQLLRWDKASVQGRMVVLPGLKKRRQLERAVYFGLPLTGTAHSK
ncbi:lysozyme [Asaia bogorensis]|uniref:lysozyme n=1 Tax=Asaia bogorensis TaxID=91915 RepID=UPI000EFCD319|nr:lysozyme [Asaia bogorensis]